MPLSDKDTVSKFWIHALLGGAGVLGLYASSLYSFLLFHSLVEIFSVIVSFVIFVLAWNTRRSQENRYLLFIGVAFLFTGALELIHALAYKGFGVIPGHGADLPTQLWIAFRYLFSITFLLAPLFITRRLNVTAVSSAYTLVTSLLFWAIFSGRFPSAFVEGKGLTHFKIVSEYVIIVFFLASLGLLLVKRRSFDRGVLRLMIFSILCSVASEFSFTQYASVFGFSNLVGHFFLLASFYFIYRAIIVIGVTEPSRLLFRNIKMSEEALKQSEARYRSLFENMIDGFALHRIITDASGRPVDYVFLEVNGAFERLTGLKRVDVVGRRVREVLPGIENDPADWIGVYGRVALTGRDVRFEQYSASLDKWYFITAYSPTKNHFVVVFEDITERKRMEKVLHATHEEMEQRVRERTDELRRTVDALQGEIRERDRAERLLKETERRTAVTNSLLKLYTQTYSRKEYLDAAMDLIRWWSGCGHLGMRVADKDGNIPYESCAGFSAEFLESENMLSLTRDHCACTRVVAGTPEPQDMAAMTPDGSFYCNHTMKFVEGLTDEQKARFRGVCIRSGFTSVAVVPIRYRDKVLGAIHLADEREGMVPLKNVEFLEQMALSVGEALFRFGIEDDLRKNFDGLQKTTELLENMFSSIHVSIAYMDRDFNFIRVNRRYAEAGGRTPDFYPGKNHFALFPYAENERIFRRVVETGEPYFAFERAFEYADHPERGVSYWDWSLVPVKEEGAVTGAVLTLIDVTERKRAEMDRIRLAAAVESAADAVVLTDPKGHVQYVNPAFEQMTGYKKEEMAGRDLHLLDSGKHDAAFYQGLRDALARDGVWSGQIISRKKDGSFYYEDCTMSPVRDQSGEVINYVFLRRDVTEKLRLESIAESVSMMDNIGYVFSGVRHEIGNPINSINAVLSILRSKLDALPVESVRNYLERMTEQIGRVEYILRSLKTFNLYETQEPQNVRVSWFMENFVPLVREDFAKKGIELEISADPSAGWACADPRALQQVLLNVLANATDAVSGRADPKVAVNVFKSGGMIHIKVRDNGIGIPADRLKDIFRPFYTTKPRGTGLGLVIVKKMLARMNGSIYIENREGAGAVVDIAIPEGTHGAGEEQ